MRNSFQSIGHALRSASKDVPVEGAFAVSTRTNPVHNIRDAEHRMKTVEIREILMEGHRERELLTTASTGN